MKFDGAAFGKEIVGVVKGYLEKELGPIATRLDALEKRIEAIPAPVDISTDLEAIKRAVAAIEMPTVPELPDIPAIVDEAIKAQMAVDDLNHSLEDLVKLAVDAIPRPQDGKSVTVEDVTPMIAAEVEKRVAALPIVKHGKDGVGVAGALIDREGNLVLTLSNGETKSLGLVIGKDGEDGEDGNPGAGIDDFDAKLLPDGRTIAMTFNGKDYEYTVELAFPTMIYRGVHREGEYTKGDTVTWAGSLWHCDAEKTVDKPGDSSKDWTLCAKKGRDGKDGSIKPEKVFEPVRVGVPSEAR